MDDPIALYQELGEVVLEEILVRAGIHQAHAAPADEIRLALDFSVGVDADRGELVVRGERLGQAALELRLALAEAPAEWRVPGSEAPSS